MKSLKKMLQGITHEDLREWAGSKIYQRGKEYVPCVSQLSQTADGALTAWVDGTDDYATWVRGDDKDKFAFHCTCPYDDWGPCKHVVAVLLAAAEQIGKNREIPLLAPEDALYLEAFADSDEDEEEDWDEDDDFDEDVAPPRSRKKPSAQVETMLADKSREELLALLLDLAADFPEVGRKIREAGQLATGRVDQLVDALRKEIRSLTAEEAWYDTWKGYGNLPDYSHVEEQLQALLDKGHVDAVFELGAELWERGVSQVEQCSDEGETAMGIARCLDIVLQALPQCSLSPSAQLLWLIEHELADDYGLLDGAEAIFDHPRYRQEDWREVAAALEARLKKTEALQSGHSDYYQRRQVVTWLCDAYSRCGDERKVIPLLEQEADNCRRYDSLIKALLESGERDRARQWCLRGFAKTIQESPGIADELQQQLRQMAEEEKKFDLAAAYRAEDFFDQPSLQKYIDLSQAAEKVDAWPAVRARVLDYLQTGCRPTSDAKGKTAWPLPEPEVKRTAAKEKFRLISFPDGEMLIRIAIHEQRLDDVVALYRKLDKNRWGGIEEQVAQTVAGSHPDVALHIWQAIAERLIAQVKPKSYQEAAGYLLKMHRVYEQTQRLTEWRGLITRLRAEHKPKRKLQEILNDLEKNRKLVD